MKKILILFMVVTMLFGLTVVALASTSISGTLYYRLNGNGSITNESDVDFFRISFSTDKTFGDDKANAYLTLQCQTYIPKPEDIEKYWNIYQYGYNYNLSDRWVAGVTYDTEGVTLSGGQLATNWEWIHVSAFNSKNALKLVGSPFDTVNVGIYLEPESMEYILKGEYKQSGIKIGFGYTNAYELTFINRKYNIYTEIVPTENSKIYLDYLSDKTYLLDTSVKFNPLTIALIYSNQQRTYLRYKIVKHVADTADISLDYALAEKKSITGGLVYNTEISDIYALYAKYNFNAGFVGVRQNSPDDYHILTDTHINGGYRIDGSNLLEADYNVTTGDWWIGMAVYL